MKKTIRFFPVELDVNHVLSVFYEGKVITEQFIVK